MCHLQHHFTCLLTVFGTTVCVKDSMHACFAHHFHIKLEEFVLLFKSLKELYLSLLRHYTHTVVILLFNILTLSYYVTSITFTV